MMRYIVLSLVLLISGLSIGCRSIPNEQQLLDKVSGRGNYRVTILDYDRKTKVVKLRREFTGPTVGRYREPMITGGVTRRGGTTRGVVSADLSGIDPTRDRKDRDALQFDVEYFKFDGYRWKQIMPPGLSEGIK